MPASSIDLFHMQDAKNNFIAMRPAPVCSDTNQLMGHCQNVHISKNCYYGFQETKNPENIYNTDCEMKEAPVINETDSSPKNGKKRCAEYFVYPESKRLREEVQTKKNIEPETTEKASIHSSTEDLLENLYWNLHGGHMFHLCYVCD
ncbi:PREDICTED: uncharacterized protein LOC106100434 isoform X1 [Papilio polytes]|uniref:uncharacterized protein LOC106100434 isoform X1 n=1 Tax=Papilio polytes TaxID=76194 RepID=UPI000675BBC2|nr:PREDICTED: uncharacterized protein LOC106100434 isoform X1 [Papilio polytes]